MSEAPQIDQLKVRLLGISPMIWRRERVLDSTILRKLQGILQVAMASGFWGGLAPLVTCHQRSLWHCDQSVEVFLVVAYWAGRPGCRCRWKGFAENRVK